MSVRRLSFITILLHFMVSLRLFRANSIPVSLSRLNRDRALMNVNVTEFVWREELTLNTLRVLL